MGALDALYVLGLIGAVTSVFALMWFSDKPALELSPVQLLLGRIFATILVLATGVHLIDSYVVQVRMPFGRRVAELPDRAPLPPPTTATATESSHTQARQLSATEQHRASLRTWKEEQRAAMREEESKHVESTP